MTSYTIRHVRSRRYLHPPSGGSPAEVEPQDAEAGTEPGRIRTVSTGPPDDRRLQGRSFLPPGGILPQRPPVCAGYLYALDPGTGHARPDFGDGGRVSLVPPSARRFSWSSGPIVRSVPLALWRQPWGGRSWVWLPSIGAMTSASKQSWGRWRSRTCRSGCRPSGGSAPPALPSSSAVRVIANLIRGEFTYCYQPQPGG